MAEAPQGYRDIPEAEQKKAQAFFDKAKTVGETGQYDFSIMLFLEGLAIDPDSVEAHQVLREISLKRKVSGGKPLGLMESMKLRPTKDDKQNMLNAEKRLAYDPGNTDHMVSLLQNAHRAGYYDTAMWIGAILLRANADSKSPEVNKFIILRDVYKDLKQWGSAVEACQYALKMRPDDMDLQSELKNLGAQQTMHGAGYAEGKSFRESMANKDHQQALLDEHRDVRTVDALTRAIHEAEQQYAADPNEMGKLTRLVDALLRTEEVEHENRAIEMLEDAYRRTKQFRFRVRVGKIKMDQLRRMERSMRQAMNADPSDEAMKRDYEQFRNEQLEFELKEYTLWAENYPTDVPLKFEQAARLFALKRYDEAIPLFQQARIDPKLKTDATISLGRAFLEAGFPEEAIETLQGVVDEYQLKGDDRSKLMYYWQGRAFEGQENSEMAIKRYSQVAQWEFTYRDVQARIKRLREAARAAKQ